MNNAQENYISSIRKTFENSILERKAKSVSIYDLSNAYFFPADKRNPEGFRKPKNSWTLVNWVISYSSLPPSAKVVAAQIASHYNSKTGYIYPTMETISYETGLNKNTVVKAVKFMVDSGEWHIEKISQKGRSKTLSFYIPRSPLKLVTAENGEKTGDTMDGPHWVSSFRTQEYIDYMKNKKETKTRQKKNLDERLEKDNKQSLRQLSGNKTDEGNVSSENNISEESGNWSENFIEYDTSLEYNKNNFTQELPPHEDQELIYDEEHNEFIYPEEEEEHKGWNEYCND